MRSRLALWALLAVSAAAPSAEASLPEGSVVLTRGATIDAGMLPHLLVADGEVYSTIATVAPFQSAPHVASDLVLYAVGETFARRLADGPVPLAGVAGTRYFDPDLGIALSVDGAPSHILAESSSESFVFLSDGRRDTIANLLAPTGSAFFFVPEPGGLAPLLLGALQLFALRRRRCG